MLKLFNFSCLFIRNYPGLKRQYVHLIKRTDLKKYFQSGSIFFVLLKNVYTFRKLLISPLINKFNYFIKINNYFWSKNIYIATCYGVPPSILLHMRIYCQEIHAGFTKILLDRFIDKKNMFFYFSHAIIVQRFSKSLN